ncbi:DNA-damage-inducible protein I [Salmonella enterica subsp. enterica serovar Choleraesuis]|nr:DNA-damage-inducible protein I [Salmonella enterica subsp. enterica serovar Choleraesuis]
MRIEVCVARTTSLPHGAMDALSGELTRRVENQFPDRPCHVQVRYASANQLTVLGASSDDREQVTAILQETWESADDWFISE